jgi:hypothetical protein
MPIKRKAKTKVIRKKVVTKTELEAQIKELIGRVEWATRIISTQQDVIDRLMKLTDKLTNTLDNFARRS